MQFTSLISKLSSFCRVPKTALITHSKRIDLNDGDVPNGQVVPKKRDAQHPIGRKLEDNRSVNIQEWKSPGFYHFYQVRLLRPLAQITSIINPTIKEESLCKDP